MTTRKDRYIKPQMRIIFNREFQRYEVYRERPIYRNGQPQPVFVHRSQIECLKYFNRVREIEGRGV